MTYKSFLKFVLVMQFFMCFFAQAQAQAQAQTSVRPEDQEQAQNQTKSQGQTQVQDQSVKTKTEVLDSIMVHGTKMQKNYFDMTESVLTLKDDEIQASGQSNSLQVLSGAPNVEVNKTTENFSIRGINSGGVTGYQKDNLASLLIDDIFQTDLALQAGSFNLWDMQSLEILRGAQSTEQGINSLAGTILLNHYKAQNFDEGAARLSLGNNKFYELALTSNKSFGPDKKTHLRLSYNKELNGGYISNTTTGNNDWDRWNRDRINLNLSRELYKNAILHVTAKYNRNHQGGSYVQGDDLFAYEVSEDKDYHTVTDNYQLGLNYTRDFFGQMQHKTLLAYSASQQNLSSDADGTSTNAAGKRKETHEDSFFSFEDRLIYKGKNLDNILGIHAHRFNLKDDYDFNLLYPVGPSTLTPIAVDQLVDRKRLTLAIFDSMSYNFNKYHSLDLGLRGELVRSKYATEIYAERTQDLGATANAALDAYINSISGPYDGDQSQFVLLPKVGYLFSTGSSTWGLKYTRGYRTSGVSINRSQAKAVEYDPEFTNNYEASYKFSDPKFYIGANIFYIDWRDQQVRVQKSADFYDTQVENAARSTVMGAELEGKTHITAKHSVYAGIGYTDTDFKDFQTATKDYAGNEFPFAAHWSGRLTHEWLPLNKLSLFTSLRTLSSSYSKADNEKKSDAQFYMDFNARYILNQWVFSTYINNIFNGKFLIYNGEAASTTSPYQASYHQVSSPREFGARVTYYW